MKNLRILVSLTVAAGSLAALVLACDDDNSGSSFREGDDAGTSEAGSFFPDSSATDGSTPVTCDPALPTTFVPTWKPPTKGTACSNTQLSDYYDLCLAQLGATDPDAGPDAATPCDTWMAANGTCATCLAPADNTGPIEFHRGTDFLYYTLNVAGCLALERGENGEEQCPAAYAGSVQCQRESCEACFSKENATFADFQTCQAAAKTSVCATLNGKVGAVCGTTYNDPDGGAYACFRQGGEDAKTHLVRVEHIFCGAE